MLYILIFKIIFSSQPIEIKKEFTSNALQILKSDFDWGTDVLSFNVMIKNNKKIIKDEDDSHYFFLSFLYLNNRLENLSKILGFKYTTRINYLFSSFSISILEESFNINYKILVDVFLTFTVEESIFNSSKADFINYYELKNKGADVYDIKSLIYNPKSTFLKFYDYSFSDFAKINLEKFSNFYEAFISPNNVVITLSNTDSVFELKKYIEKFKNRFVSNVNTKPTYDVVSSFPRRVVKFIGSGSNTSLKIAFDASRCGVKESIYYELLIELLREANFKARVVVPEYTCYSKFGFFEVSFFDIQTSIEDTILNLKNFLSLSLEKLDKQRLSAIKKNLISKYLLLYLDKEKFTYLIGKSYILENTINYFLTFEQRVELIEVDEFKYYINTIINKNYYELVVRG